MDDMNVLNEASQLLNCTLIINVLGAEVRVCNSEARSVRKERRIFGTVLFQIRIFDDFFNIKSGYPSVFSPSVKFSQWWFRRDKWESSPSQIPLVPSQYLLKTIIISFET